MDTLCTIAITAAKAAGHVIMEEYKNTTFTIKADGSPVTHADMKSHKILTDILAKTNIPILSEESESNPISHQERLWIIDPIDGTKDFLAKTGDFAVMIALVEQGEPTIGIVYAPAQEKLYFAKKNKGAYLEISGTSRQIHVKVPENRLRCVSSVHHINKRSTRVTNILNAELIPRGCVGIKAGLIADGNAEFAFYFGKLGEWDVAAPSIILTEAGGCVTDITGNPLQYNNTQHRIQKGVVFSNKICHTAVLTAIQEAGEED